MKKISCILLSCTAIVMLVKTTHADSGALQGANGGTLKAYNNDAIEMVAETITMNIVDNPNNGTIVAPHADVQVTYTFHNTTKEPVTVMTGFPERDQGVPLHNFKATINGKPVATVKQAGQDSVDPVTNLSYTEYWYTYHMSFAPGESLTVSNSYSQDAIGREGSSGYQASYPYILDTGATWKGVIQSVTLVVHLTNIDVHRIASLQPVYKDNLWAVSDGGKTLTLSMHNIKPTVQDNFNLTSSDNTANNINGCNWKVSDVHDIDNPQVATASSAKAPDLTPTISTVYYACQAFDGDNKTAWITSDGQNPIGQHLKYNLPNIQLGRVYDSVNIAGGLSEAANGMNAGLKYSDYSRPKKVRLTFSSAGKNLYTTDINIPDSSGGSVVPLPDAFVLTNKDDLAQAQADIQIVDVYPGTKYANLAINEFNLQSYPNNTFVEKTQPKTFALASQPAADQNNSSVMNSEAHHRSRLWWLLLPAFLLIIAAVWRWNYKHSNKQQ